MDPTFLPRTMGGAPTVVVQYHRIRKRLSLPKGSVPAPWLTLIGGGYRYARRLAKYIKAFDDHRNFRSSTIIDVGILGY